MEYEKKIAKPHYNAVIQRYDSKPNKPKVIKKDTLNRLADPIKYRYNGDSNVKSSAENIDAENVNLNISSQGPVMVKRGNDGALAISIDTEAIKRNAGAQSGPIKIQLPAQHGAVHEGTFLTGGNETPVHEASSKGSIDCRRRGDWMETTSNRSVWGTRTDPTAGLLEIGAANGAMPAALPAAALARKRAT